jgi:hypothetical protein
MIIWGSRTMTSTCQKGRFACPRCNGASNFAEKRVRNWFTLYFLPIFPMSGSGYYVECQDCRGTFKPDVLTYSGIKPSAAA